MSHGTSLDGLHPSIHITQRYHSWHMPKGSPSNSTDTRASILIAALFTLAGRQNQPKCPSSREWILRV